LQNISKKLNLISTESTTTSNNRNYNNNNNNNNNNNTNTNSTSKQDYETYDYEQIKKIGPSLTGLVNLGNTCYLNSIIQSLFACKKFVKSLIEIDVQQLNEAAENDFSFLNQLKILFSIMLLTQRPAVKATNFVKHCTPSWFRFGQQQDSSEFLIFLLDNLDEQLKKFDPIFINLVKKSFGIQLKTECKCSNCNTTTARNDVCFYIPLSFHTKAIDKKIPLKSLINHFFEVENLSSETGNSYFCTNCNSLQNAFKQIYLSRNEEMNVYPPDYLIFTLNRFIYQANNDGSVQNNLKIMEQVDYPTKIEINTYDVDNKLITETYCLHSIVVHSGSSLHYGHYYTYMVCQFDSNETNENWYLANDSKISKISYESLSSNQNLFKDDTPYLLFYSKLSISNLTVEQTSLNIENKLNIQVQSKRLIEMIEQDNKIFENEEKNRILKSKKTSQNDDKYSSTSKIYYSSKDDDDDQSGGGGGFNF
jgi:ubiquitin C-terminal hydrolase